MPGPDSPNTFRPRTQPTKIGPDRSGCSKSPNLAPNRGALFGSPDVLHVRLRHPGPIQNLSRLPRSLTRFAYHIKASPLHLPHSWTSSRLRSLHRLLKAGWQPPKPYLEHVLPIFPPLRCRKEHPSSSSAIHRRHGADKDNMVQAAHAVAPRGVLGGDASYRGLARGPHCVRPSSELGRG